MTIRMCFFLASVGFFAITTYFVGRFWFLGVKTKYLRLFMSLGLCISMLTLFNGFYVISDPVATYPMHIFSIFFMCIIPFNMLLFSLEFTENKLAKSKPITYVIIILSIIDVTMLLSNPMHHLFYVEITQADIVHGWFFWIHAFFSYFSLITSIVMTGIYFYKNVKLRSHMVLFLLALATPIIVSAFAIPGIIPHQYDFSGLSTMIAFIAYAYYSAKFKIMNIHETAFTDIFTSLIDALVVSDGFDRVAFSNMAFHKLFPNITIKYGKTSIKQVIDLVSDRAEKQFPDSIFSEIQQRNDQAIHGEISLADQNGENRSLSVSKKSILRNGKNIGFILTLSDVTNYRKMIDEIESKNETLNVIKEISALISSSHDLPQKILRAFEMLSEFTEIDRIMVYSIENGNAQDPHIWLRRFWDAPSIHDIKAPTRIIPFHMIEMELSEVRTNGKLVIDDLRDRKTQLSQYLLSIGGKSFFIMPLREQESIYGYFLLETFHKFKHWTNLEIDFIQTISGIFVTAFVREQMQEEIITERDNANAANRAKSEFLSRMSHEIRTPMNAIVGMTKIAESSIADPSKVTYCLRKIDQSSMHLLGLINDILDMSKIEANKLEINEEPFDFYEMLDRIQNIISVRAAEKNQHISFHIASDIPRGIISDELRISQVITNLLSNAVKFTPDHGLIALDIRYECLPDNDEGTLLFSVIDNGIGITPDQKARLFESFVQAERSTTRKYGGTGLGLAISKRIVNLMGGELDVESEVGKGSRFYFSIRIKRCKEFSDAKPHFTNDSVLSNTYSHCRILLVDDIEINREIAMALLEETKIQIDCAENGQEAFDKFSQNPELYDAICMDIQMPVMDGLEATTKIRAINNAWANQIPIVAMTANAFKEDVDACKLAGMNDHIGKPIHVNELFGKLAKYLGNKADQPAEG